MKEVFWQEQFDGVVKVGNRLYTVMGENEWRCKQVWENGAIEAVEIKYKVSVNGMELGTFTRREFLDRFNDIFGPYDEHQDIGTLRIDGGQSIGYAIDQIEVE